MNVTKITCDQCGSNLSDSGAMPSYRLVLNAERIKQSGGISYAVHVDPDISRPHHFCGLMCLGKWVVRGSD